MPSKTVKITTGSSATPPIEVTHHFVRLQPNVNLKFKNKLDGDVTASVRFYDIDDKGGDVIEDFCEGQSGEVFSVPPDTPTVCKPQTDGQFSYTISASGHQTLDPVLIIEPNVSAMMPSDFTAPTFDPFIPGLALIIGLLLGWMLGKGKG